MQKYTTDQNAEYEHQWSSKPQKRNLYHNFQGLGTTDRKEAERTKEPEIRRDWGDTASSGHDKTNALVNPAAVVVAHTSENMSILL